ncbi:tetratricopeptide repeat-containing serine/threonine-protein kinase [Nostoc sp. CHAB 5784]|uniref:protein kinase family protein n=1 Tax=Nostoc mirabile TaxID=2907820 RepID=UPI001E4D11D9|nr:protein kinase family protein [Nostoc mirabile]MCC5668167.1 tetratricopeptide repeat-containing serine/threonine-protein kinase [Nostoc mirabile CHAB5784]
MSYCINPLCTQRHNPDDIENCLACGNPLLINKRFRLLHPLRSLDKDPYTYTDIFEVEDVGIVEDEDDSTESYPHPQRKVMKILKWIDEPKLVELLRRESILLQILDHPGIPKSNRGDYFALRLNDNRLELHCLVMQKFEGKDLGKWIKSYGKIPQSLALDWLSQLMDILDLVHRSGVFHRDIKPNNIIFQPNGKLALIDFGGARDITRTYLAKVSTSGGTSTGLGSGHDITIVRTACFSPLEQINGQAVPQSDFYALGRTFVNLVTGIPLIQIKSDERTGRLLWRNKAPHIDKSLADFIDDLMAPFPGQRPQNTQVILQRLQKLPLQNKIYKLIRSKIFITSATIASITLGSLGISKIVLPIIINNLVIQGEKLEAANDSQAAQKLFDSAIKINPQVKASISKFYFDKGLRSTNSLELAKNYYELAIKYNDRDIESYNNLGIVCKQLYDYECVINTYRKSFKLNFDNWEGHYGLGIFYDDKMKYDLAEQQYQLAIKSNSKTILPINNLSRLKILKGDYNTAISLAQEGLKKAKTPRLQAVLYKNLGWAKFEQKKYGEARQYLEKAKELDMQRTSILSIHYNAPCIAIT